MNIKSQVYVLGRKLSPKCIYQTIKLNFLDLPLIYYYDYDNNWGDTVNDFIFESILEKKVVSSNCVFNFRNKEIITGIGSVLSGKLSNYSIWGSGFLLEKQNLFFPPNEILALRGKLSNQKIKSKFGLSSGLFGDPALLFRDYYLPNKEKEFKLGIIPHFKEIGDPILNQIKEKYKNEVTIISPQMDIFNFADEVYKCERVLSSSLHGLILADSFGIPTLRIKISEKVIGGDFKFNDYYSGINVDYNKLKTYSLQELFEQKKILSNLGEIKDVNFNKIALIESLKSKF